MVLLVAGGGIVALTQVFAKGAAQPSSDGVVAPALPPGSGCQVVSPVVPGAVDSGLAVQPLCALPVEAEALVPVIQRGGPFGYAQDGTTFRNAERRLPLRGGAYYREFTVPTPGSPDRGARRLVVGQAGEVYYTADHYDSFVVVDVAASR